MAGNKTVRKSINWFLRRYPEYSVWIKRQSFGKSSYLLLTPDDIPCILIHDDGKKKVFPSYALQPNSVRNDFDAMVKHMHGRYEVDKSTTKA